MFVSRVIDGKFHLYIQTDCSYIYPKNLSLSTCQTVLTIIYSHLHLTGEREILGSRIYHNGHCHHHLGNHKHLDGLPYTCNNPNDNFHILVHLFHCLQLHISCSQDCPSIGYVQHIYHANIAIRTVQHFAHGYHELHHAPPHILRLRLRGGLASQVPASEYVSHITARNTAKRAGN